MNFPNASCVSRDLMATSASDSFKHDRNRFRMNFKTTNYDDVCEGMLVWLSVTL